MIAEEGMRFAALALWIALGSTAASQGQVIQTLPRGFETTEGSGWDETLTNASQPARVHWNYSWRNFSTTGAIEITQVELRPDGAPFPSPASALPQVELSLGLLKARHMDPVLGNSLEGRFDDSFPRPFFAGRLDLPALASSTNPRPWLIALQGPPLRFDPRDGRDLALEWRVRSPATGAWAALDMATYVPENGLHANRTSADGSAIAVSTPAAVPIVRIHYRPAQDLHAAFRMWASLAASTVIVGTPLQLMDLSSTPSPRQIRSWAWDFENDGIVDSTLQHPIVRYTRCGDYDVRLTVTDSSNAVHSVLRRRFVHAHDATHSPLIPRFSSQRSYSNGNCPLIVSYFDESEGPVTSWAWDFESDGIVDSTARNPIFTPTRTGSRVVRLDIGSACGTRFLEVETYDLCQRADECPGLTLPAALAPITNRSATDSPWPSPCARARSDVWYQIPTLSPYTGYAISACPVSGPPGFRPQVQIYTGTCANLVLLACVESSCVAATSPNFLTHPGQSYYARISDAQGLQGEFRLDVRAFDASMGNIARPFPACGGAALDVQGTPRPGNALSFFLNAQGRPSAIWLGTGISPTPLCDVPCFLTTFTHIVVAGSTTVFPIPNGSYVLGARFFAQGAILGQGAGCDLGSGNGLLLSETIQVDVR
jgi:hypothetical protein